MAHPLVVDDLPTHPAVCAARCSTDAALTYNKWALPGGTVFLRNRSCEPTAELGVDHIVLPVTHTRVGASEGLFFYYARRS